MTPYQPQPGTIPYRAIAWLQENGYDSDSAGASTSVICDELGCDSAGFKNFMRTALVHGMVQGEPIPGHGRVLFWRLMQKAQPQRVAHPHRLPAGVFRALEWEGNILATGMEIIDGVAVFTPEQVRELKQVTDWARAV